MVAITRIELVFIGYQPIVLTIELYRYGTGKGSRTHTSQGQRILSPSCLPIPTYLHIGENEGNRTPIGRTTIYCFTIKLHPQFKLKIFVF